MVTFDEGGLGLGLEWARCPKCKEEGVWENDVFECGVCFGTFRRTKYAPNVASAASAEPDSGLESIPAVESDTQPRGLTKRSLDASPHGCVAFKGY